MPVTSATLERRPTLPDLLVEEQRHRSTRRIVLWGLGLALAAAATVAVVWTYDRPTASPVWRREAVVIGDVMHEVSATGRLEARGTVSVGPESSGRVAAVEVDFNDHVHRGQVLARLDTSALRAQRDEARAAVSAARVAVHAAELTADQAARRQQRVAPLHGQGMASDEENDAADDGARQAAEDIAGARARLAQAVAGLALAQTNLDHGEIRAPIDGVVVTRAVDPGQAVAAALQSPELFVIAEDLGKMRVVADIDEADVGQVAVGQPARFTVDAFAGETFAAAVTELHTAPRITQDVVTYEAILSVDNPGHRLLPGMTASVKIVTRAVQGALVVPNAALRWSPPGPPSAHHGVWLVDDAGQPRPVELAVDVTDGSVSAVRGALQPGDQVIVGGGAK